MKKTLLIAAAALAAGVISSEAQAVYSQNIVGYVNYSLVAGYNTVAIPLNATDANGVNNAITNTIQNPIVNGSGLLDGVPFYIFNGHSFATYYFDSGMSTGIGDANDANPVAPPVINPGNAIYINNNSGNLLTNTFVGNVAISSVPGSTTNAIPAGQKFFGSILPVGGGITSALQLTNTIVAGSGVLDGAPIYIPNISGGSIHGYTTVYFDSGMATGFGDANDANPVAEPNIPVAGGFILNNNTGGGTINWTQSLSAQ